MTNKILLNKFHFVQYLLNKNVSFVEQNHEQHKLLLLNKIVVQTMWFTSLLNNFAQQKFVQGRGQHLGHHRAARAAMAPRRHRKGTAKATI